MSVETHVLFHEAAHRGSVKEVEQILGAGFDVNDPDDEKHGDTALHTACGKGHYELAKLLIFHGADVESKQSLGYTPMHYACLNDNAGCVALLVKSGGNPYTTNDAGDTPINLAEHRHHVACVDAMKRAVVPYADKDDVRMILKELKSQGELVSYMVGAMVAMLAVLIAFIYTVSKKG